MMIEGYPSITAHTKMETSAKQRALYLKQASLNAKSAAKLTVCGVLATAGSWMIWRDHWPLRLALWGTVLFFAITCFELLAIWSISRRSPQHTDHEIVPGDHGFRYVKEDSDGWFERQVTIDNLVVKVRISPLGFDEILPYASKLFNQEDELTASFREFRSHAASENKTFSKEILALDLSTIDFWSLKQPHIAEVTFTRESGGEPWTCLLEGTKFYGLLMES